MVLALVKHLSFLWLPQQEGSVVTARCSRVTEQTASTRRGPSASGPGGGAAVRSCRWRPFVLRCRKELRLLTQENITAAETRRQRPARLALLPDSRRPPAHTPSPSRGALISTPRFEPRPARGSQVTVPQSQDVSAFGRRGAWQASGPRGLTVEPRVGVAASPGLGTRQRGRSRAFSSFPRDPRVGSREPTRSLGEGTGPAAVGALPQVAGR